MARPAKDVAKRRTKHEVPWLVVALVIGLGLAHLGISFTFGSEIASAVVAAFGVAYAALNVLVGAGKDTRTAGLLARVVTTSRVTAPAVVIVWLTAVLGLAFPVVDATASARFTILVQDEFRQPTPNAHVTVLGEQVRIVETSSSTATVKYYPMFSSPSLRIKILNQGIATEIAHRMTELRRYPDVTVAVWSGKPALDAAHFTVRGAGIGAFLAGRLPPDLQQRFPRLRLVVKNDVFDTTRELLDAYDEISRPDFVAYERDGKPMDPNDSRLDRYRKEMEGLSNARRILGVAELDFSATLLGAPVTQPLPPGYAASLGSDESWYVGSESTVSDADLNLLMSRFGATVLGDERRLSLSVEKALDAKDLQAILDNATELHGYSDYDLASDLEIRLYLKFLIKMGAPLGLVGGNFSLDPMADCAPDPIHLAMDLPEPTLRVTILQNTSDKPIQIDHFVMIQANGEGFHRRNKAVSTTEQDIRSGVLQPGESVLVPRELSMEASYSELDLAEIMAPSVPNEQVLQFHLAPLRLPTEGEDGFQEDSVDPNKLRPRSISVLSSKIHRLEDSPTAEDAESGSESSSAFPRSESSGNEFVIGPSIKDVDYVVNGVRMRARSDLRIVVAMYGEWASGSCPFIFASYPGSPKPFNLGQTIINRIGRTRYGTDRLQVAAGFSRLEIRELEDEVSYIDSVELVVYDDRGEHIIAARNQNISRKDERYAVLRKGEAVILNFPDFSPSGDWEAVIRVSGYYVPLKPAEIANVI